MYGSLVKRLRLRPLTAASRVRFPYESPKRSKVRFASFFVIQDNLFNNMLTDCI